MWLAMKFLSEPWLDAINRQLTDGSGLDKVPLNRPAQIQVKINCEQEKHRDLYFDIGGGTADVRFGKEDDDASAVVLVDYEVAAGIHSGQIDVSRAFTDGLLNVIRGAFIVADQDEFFRAYVEAAESITCDY